MEGVLSMWPTPSILFLNLDIFNLGNWLTLQWGKVKKGPSWKPNKFKSVHILLIDAYYDPLSKL